MILNESNQDSIADVQSCLKDASPDLEDKIINADDGDEISIDEGTYYLHNITITKNITLKGNGYAKNIIIDCEQKSSIFLIRNDAVHVSFKNLTFINANIMGFGGAISMETGHVYVDNCIFANNTASVNAGGISNYGTSNTKGHLLVNNSLFINNHGGHDGGAITTCYANSYIYNTVFINNSAHRDGGAIRVSVEGYGDVQDCIFMYNHADEWGGAYYSWSGTSNIERCIFLNNTAGTNGGAVMVSGNINLEKSIIMDNEGGTTGGSFYIQQPMYDAATTINIHDNLITNNTSPYGKEIFIKWDDVKHLFTKFNDNDWGDEDPNDPSVIDPDKVSIRREVTSTIKSNLMNELNFSLLTKYRDLIESYFPSGYLNSIDKQSDDSDNNKHEKTENENQNDINSSKEIASQNYVKTNESSENTNINTNSNTTTNNNVDSNKLAANGNSTAHGKDKNAYELNETSKSVAKSSSLDIRYFIATIAVVLILLAIGYKTNRKEE